RCRRSGDPRGLRRLCGGAVGERALAPGGTRRARAVLGGPLRTAGGGAEAGDEGTQATGLDGRRQPLRRAVRGQPRRPRVDHPALGRSEERRVGKGWMARWYAEE